MARPPIITLAAALLLGSAAPAAAAAPRCLPAQPAPEVMAAPATWQQAVAALVRSTAEPGHPWSCRGGVIGLEIHAGGAILTVTPGDEPPMRREVRLPEEILPLGQALLAMPAERPAAVSPPARVSNPAEPPTPAVPRQAAVPAAVATDPGIGVSARVGGRLTERPLGATIGGSLAVVRPIGRWRPSLRLRWQHRGRRGDVHEDLSAALGFGRAIPLAIGELRLGLTGAVAVLIHDPPRPLPIETRIEARAGAAASVAVRLSERLRLLVALDADVAPAALLPPRDATPGFARWTAGADLGLEVAL